MFDFLKGLFVWVVKKILFIFFPVLAWIVFFFENFSDTIKAVWNYFISFLRFYFQDFYIWCFNQLMELLTTYFSDNAFVVDVAEFSTSFFTAMNVFLPLNEMCCCLMFLLISYVNVWLLRIVLKAIPTIW